LLCNRIGDIAPASSAGSTKSVSITQDIREIGSLLPNKSTVSQGLALTLSTKVKIDEKTLESFGSKEKLKLPHINDSLKWRILDDKICEALFYILPSSKLKSMDISRVMEKFENIIYNIIKEECGTVQSKKKKTSRSKTSRSYFPRDLAKIQNLKKVARRNFCKLKKAKNPDVDRIKSAFKKLMNLVKLQREYMKIS